MCTYSAATDGDHYRPGYNPEFKRRVLAKRREQERKEALAREAAAREARELAEEQARRLAEEQREQERLAQEADAKAEREERAIKEYRVINLSSITAVRPSARTIIERVSMMRGIPYAEIVGASRMRPIAAVRQEAMYEVRKHRPDLSLSQIGRIFGGCDHTTVLHAIRKIEAIRAAKPKTVMRHGITLPQVSILAQRAGEPR